MTTVPDNNKTDKNEINPDMCDAKTVFDAMVDYSKDMSCKIKLNKMLLLNAILIFREDHDAQMENLQKMKDNWSTDGKSVITSTVPQKLKVYASRFTKYYGK